MKEGIEKWDSEVQKEKVRYFLEKKSNVWWPLSLIFSFLLAGRVKCSFSDWWSKRNEHEVSLENS